MPAGVGVAVVQRENPRKTHVGPIQPILMDGLVVLLVDPFGRTVGGEHQQGNLLVESFDHRRAKIVSCGARGADQCHRLAQLLGQPQRHIAGRTFVVDHVQGQRRVAGQGHCQRRRAGAWGDDSMAQTSFDKNLDRQLDQREHTLCHAQPATVCSAPSTASIVSALRAVSRHSAAGSESAVIPAPT